MSPPRVDFYVLNHNKEQAIVLLACQLLEKAYLHRHTVFVYCDNVQEAENLDELLWTFKEDSFIPHNLQGEGPIPPPPIQIGCAEPKGFTDILMNLSASIPPFSVQFRRIIELVSGAETAKEISREHFRQYKLKNYALHTHML